MPKLVRQNNSENAVSLFWRLLGKKAANEGIKLDNPEDNVGIIPFAPGIVNSFFKGWIEAKSEKEIHPTIDDR